MRSSAGSFPRRVFARAIPVDHRSHGEGVAKIMDARSPAMSVVMLMSAQADPLAGMRKVVTCTTVGQPRSLTGDEERIGNTPEQPVTLGSVAKELRYHRRVEREQSFFAELPRRRSTPFSTSRSSGRAQAPLILSPVTAMSPNKVEQVHRAGRRSTAALSPLR